MQKLILDAKPDLSELYIPHNKYRKKLYGFVSDNKFDTLIMFFILLNILSMGMTFYDESPQYTYILMIFNLIFTGIFILEAVLKIIAGGIFFYIN